MAIKKPFNVEIGIQLDKQNSNRTYNERDEGLLYNKGNEGIRVQTEGADREVVTDTQTQTISNKTLETSTLNSPSINNPTLSNGTITGSTLNTVDIELSTVLSSSINSCTLSDSMIDLDNNTLTNIEIDNFKSGVVISSVSSVSTNNEIPTSKAVFDFIGNGVSTDLSNHISDTVGAHTASAISNTPSGNLAATDVQGAVNELQSDIDNRALDSGVVHNTGNENVAGIKTFTDTTESTTKDNGALIVEGGVGIEKNLNIGGDVVITGGLQVNGTTTFVNTDNLQVKDAVIEVNKGGNQAAANSADAGIAVVMTDATTAQIGYDSTLASKFAIGEVGSLKEIVDVSSTQSLSGKTIDGDVNTIQDVGLGSLKTVLADASKFIARDGSGAVVSTNTVPSGTVVGTSDTQVLTNKDIDGGTASNAKRITVPKDTVTNLNALTRKEGTVVYATDVDKLYVDDGTNLNPVGSGGVGNPGVYSLLKSDEDTTTWSSGNNASFLGGGSVQGTFTKQNATNPLNGTYSYTFVQASGSLNDYIASNIISVPIRARGNTNCVDIVYTYDGADSDIKWVVYDVTNSTILSSITALVKYSTITKSQQIIFDMPSNCTQIRFGFQVLVANNGKTLKFDDAQLGTWTYQVANLISIAKTIAVTTGGVASTGSPYYMYFNSVSKTEDQVDGSVVTTGSGDVYISGPTDSTNGLKIYSRKSGLMRVTTNITKGQTSYNNLVYLNGSNLADFTNLWYTSNSGQYTVSFELFVKANDYIQLVSPGGFLSISNTAFIEATLIGKTENIIQSFQDGTDWTSLTYTQVNALSGNQGFGTYTAGSVEWKRDGSDLLYKGKLTTGTVAVSEARIPFPSGLVSANSTIIPSIQLAEGMLVCNQNSGTPFNILIEPSVGYFTIGFQTGTNAGLTKVNGIYIVTSGGIISFNVRIPIQGWSSSPTLVSLPTSKENVFSAIINADGTIASKSSDWIASVTKAATGQYDIVPKAGIFTVAPSVSGIIKDTGAAQGSVCIYYNKTLSASLIPLAVCYGGSGYDRQFLIVAQKQAPDYVAPGVFVGNVQPDWQYDLTVTGTNWTTTRAVGVVYKTGNGAYRLKFNIVGTQSPGVASQTLSISGIVFKNLSNYNQSVTVSQAALLTCSGFVNPNSSNISLSTNGTNSGSFYVSGDVELESKPSWATNTP